MSTDMAFPRTEEYIGRTEVLDTIRTTLAELRQKPASRALYIEAVGGLGKTFLLERLPGLVRSADDGERIARIIDLSDPEKRSGGVIELAIISGLMSNRGQWYRFPNEQVRRAFASYLEQRSQYERHRGSLRPPELLLQRNQLRHAFVEAFNSLASTAHPIVLRFDTLEAIGSEAPRLTTSGDTFPSAQDIVLEWIAGVLPALRHTLAIFCGRPGPAANPLLTTLRQHGLLAVADKVELTSFGRPEIRRYLAAYGQTDLDDADFISVEHRTEGRPLLLTCYAQARASGSDFPGLTTEGAAVPALSTPTPSRESFEDAIVRSILSPISSGPAAQRFRGYCLFVLAYARRGLTSDQLRECLGQLGYLESFDERLLPQVLDDLQRMALVKVRADTDLLYLHDEIFQMIDRSAQPRALGLGDGALQFLIELSRRNLHAARDRVARFTAANNLVYYELTRDIAAGYRQYLLATDYLFSTGNTDQAQALRDELWRFLNQPFNQARLRHETPLLTQEQVTRDDAVWLVKYYLAINSYEQAVRVGSQVRMQFAADLESDDFFRVDLYTAYANALTLLRPPDQAQALELFNDVIATLDRDPATIRDAFLRSKLGYYRGIAYTLRGYLWRTLSSYAEAAADYEVARRAYYDYTKAGPPDFDVIETQAQVQFNLIYALTMLGKLEWARDLAETLLQPAFFDRLSKERQAIALNVNAVVNLALAGGLREAYEYVSRAWKIAEELPSIRIRGLVARELGSVLSEQVELYGEPNLEAAKYFDQAANIFADEAPNLRETWFEYGRYERRLGRLYAQRGERQAAEQHFRKALNCFDNALLVLGEDRSSMYRAELLESKAVVYRWLGDIATATRLIDEAEAILRTGSHPTYVQVIAGTLAYKRGQFAMDNGQIPEAMAMFAVALARCYVFSSTNRTVLTFDKRIRRYIRSLSDEALREAYRVMHEPGALPPVQVQDLPYQPPDTAAWAASWDRATARLRDLTESTANSRSIF